MGTSEFICLGVLYYSTAGVLHVHCAAVEKLETRLTSCAEAARQQTAEVDGLLDQYETTVCPASCTLCYSSPGLIRLLVIYTTITINR